MRARAEHVPDVGITDAMYPSTTRVSVDLFDTYGVRDAGGSRLRCCRPRHHQRHRQSQLRRHVSAGTESARPVVSLRDKPNVAQVGWHQIVGVVQDFPAFPINDFRREGVPTIYHPAGVGDLSPAVLSVRFAGAVPPTFINRFRHIGAEVDPALQLTEVGVLSDRSRRAARAHALGRVGDRAHHGQRPAALGRRDLRVDVVYRRAAHTRDWHPYRAWRAATATGAERVRTRRVRRSSPALWWARCSRPAPSWRSVWARCAPCHSCWPWPRSW